METTALVTDVVDLDIYIALGLQDLGKKIIEIPRVLSVVSTLLEGAVQKNEILLETKQIKDVVTIFHGLRAPALSIKEYVNRIFKYSGCSPSCFVVAHIYVNRFLQRTDVQLTSLNVHRLIITSVMLAAKFIDDAFFNNAYYAKVGGVSTAELNKLEMEFLFAIDFRLQVSEETFGLYCSELDNEAMEVVQIEQQMQACRINQSWSNKDDSYAPAFAR